MRAIDADVSAKLGPAEFSIRRGVDMRPRRAAGHIRLPRAPRREAAASEDALIAIAEFLREVRDAGDIRSASAEWRCLVRQPDERAGRRNSGGLRRILCPAGWEVYVAGQEEQALFILLEGTAEVILETPHAGERTVAELPAGAFFGECSFFHPLPAQRHRAGRDRFAGAAAALRSLRRAAAEERRGGAARRGQCRKSARRAAPARRPVHRRAAGEHTRRKSP